MMGRRGRLCAGASVISLGLGALSAPALAAPAAPSPALASSEQNAAGNAQAGPPGASTQPDDASSGEVVVTGVRRSLERAAEIKQSAVQVVDSIVAQDIGKLPDPTTAAALQRVPGVQVSVNRNNELGDVRVRGLPDVLTTVNGREVFTTAGRNFDLQDLPAEALARVDVYKSQTADLIEGGLAGTIDLQLNKPFTFRKPTVVVSARGNYGVRAKDLGKQFGLLLTDRFDTGAGEVGVLLNGTYSKTDYYRAQTILRERRSSATTPFNTPGLLLPTILQNFPERGYIERRQINGAIQWQASPAVQVYLDGLYTYFRDRGAHEGANAQAFTTNVTLGGVMPSNRCITARVLANGQNPTIAVDAAGRGTLPANTTQSLCEPDLVTFNNLVLNQTTQARDINQRNLQFAGGLRVDQDGWAGNVDASYQKSTFNRQNITSDIGQRLPSLTVDTDDDGDAHYTVPGDALTSTTNLFIRNALIQNFTHTTGSLWAVKGDLSKELDGVLRKVRVGARYARREATQRDVNSNTALPAGVGNIGTATEATAVRVSALGLPADFLALSARAPDLNNGSRFYVPNYQFLLDDSRLDLLRAFFRLAPGRPAYDPTRQFDATEKTLAGFAQASYEIPLGGDALIDGVIGARVARTERTIGTFVRTAGVLNPVSATTKETDVLPNATARLKLGNGIQFRAGFQKSLRRPNFTDLNPAVTLNASNNPLVQATGTAGNPTLKPQKSDSYDLSAEYYFRGGYVAVAGYYRNITDRVITAAAVENFNGVDYAVSRPRNVGKARLQGVEVSSQYFLDFLPGGLSGLGLQGSFTFSDSKIQGNDPLVGNPLQGVSKYNYTAGLLYEKFGISGRLVYTFRSKYFNSDDTGTPTLRPVDPARVAEVYVPTLLTYVRPAGRLDFNVGVDITKALRIDVGGTNILKQRTRSYYGYEGITHVNNEINYDETTYSVGARFKF